MGKNSRCAGILEMKNKGEWRPVADWDSKWDQKSAAAICRLLDCGSVVSNKTTDDAPDQLVWWIKASCVQSSSAPTKCIKLTDDSESYFRLEVVCSGKTEESHLKLLSSLFDVFCDCPHFCH